jgi:hypothetical protein
MTTLAKINDTPASAFWMRVGSGATPSVGRLRPASASGTSASQVVGDASTTVGPVPTFSQPKPPDEVPPEVRDLFTPAFSRLPPAERIKRVAAKLKEVNPKSYGKVNYLIKNAEVIELSFPGYGVMNLWPVRALTNLKVLRFERKGWDPYVNDLSPLRGMQLIILDCSRCAGVVDISPLKGMPLRELNLSDCRRFGGDLSPLAGMLLRELNFTDCRRLTDLVPLRGMPLQKLTCCKTKVSDLSPLKGMPLEFLQVDRAKVTDLTPLKEMPKLRELRCDFVADRDAEILRSIQTLRTINNLPAKEFWRRVDAGEAPQPK